MDAIRYYGNGRTQCFPVVYHARFSFPRTFGREPRVLVFVREVAAALPVHHCIALVTEHEIFFFQRRVGPVDFPRQVHCNEKS